MATEIGVVYSDWSLPWEMPSGKSSSYRIRLHYDLKEETNTTISYTIRGFVDLTYGYNTKFTGILVFGDSRVTATSPVVSGVLDVPIFYYTKTFTKSENETTVLLHAEVSPERGGWEQKTVNVSADIPIPPKYYTITFNANGGSNPPASQNKIHGTNLTLTTETPTRAGYDFVSWNTASDGSGTSYESGAAFSTNADTTLYAQWHISYAPPKVENIRAYRVANGKSGYNPDVLSSGTKIYTEFKLTNPVSGTVTVSAKFGTTASASSGTSGSIKYFYSPDSHLSETSSETVTFTLSATDYKGNKYTYTYTTFVSKEIYIFDAFKGSSGSTEYQSFALGGNARDFSSSSRSSKGDFDCYMDASFKGSMTIATPLPIASGGTGASTVAAARNNLGLGNTSGAVPVANGGTGATSLAVAQENLGIKANSERIAATATDLNTQKSRIDQFTALAEGSTTGDAELMDIRVGADGTTYDTAGNAVRGQIGELKSDLVNLSFTDGLTKFIRELYLIGDLIDRYHVYIVRKEPNGFYGYRIAIADSSNNIVSYLYNVTEEPRNPVYIPEYNNSGISAYAVLNWDNIEDSENVYNVSINKYAYDIRYTNCIQKVLQPIKSTFSVENHVEFISELFLVGTKLYEDYHIYIIRKGNAELGYRIAIADNSNNIVSYLYGVSEEPRNPVYIPEYNNSGISAYAVLNWDNIEDSENVYNIRFTDNAIDVTKNKIIFESINKAKYDSFIDISVPSKINAVVGDTLQLYYAGIFRCVNPYNYDIQVTCDIGQAFPRYFELTPTNEDFGNHTITFSILDNNGNVINTKICSLYVSYAPGTVNDKNVLCVGASLTQNGIWVKEFKRKLNSVYGQNIKTVGRISVNDVNLEATGGYTWDDYINPNTPGLYKFFFNAEHLPSIVNVGNIYTSDGYSYTVTEINIPTTDGGGYISCKGNGYSQSGTLTLTNGTGDSVLTFNSSTYSGNPFANNGNIDIRKYANEYCNGSIDYVFTELFVNGSIPYNDNLSEMLNKMNTFISLFRNVFQNCKFAIGVPSVPDMKGGIGTNYNAVGGWSYGYGIKYTMMNYVSELQKYIDEHGMSDYVAIVPWTNEVDSENDYMYIDKPVNVRSTQTEKLGINAFHPSEIGYLQMADSSVRTFICNYCN